MNETQMLNIAIVILISTSRPPFVAAIAISIIGEVDVGILNLLSLIETIPEDDNIGYWKTPRSFPHNKLYWNTKGWLIILYLGEAFLCVPLFTYTFRQPQKKQRARQPTFQSNLGFLDWRLYISFANSKAASVLVPRRVIQFSIFFFLFFPLTIFGGDLIVRNWSRDSSDVSRRYKKQGKK